MDIHEHKHEAGEKRLALFDLDDTILAGDSDHLWGLYLIKHGKVTKEDHLNEHLSFKQDYHEGRLDMHAYIQFSTRALRKHPRDQMLALRKDFTTTTLLPLIRPEMKEIMERHKQNGETVIIITATNEFVVGDICNRLPADTFLATQLETAQDGTLTGAIKGVPSFREGKWTRLKSWLTQNPGHTLEGSTFYSDSFNDLFLLEKVTYPIVINGDKDLLDKAKEAHWKVLFF